MFIQLEKQLDFKWRTKTLQNENLTKEVEIMSFSVILWGDLIFHKVSEKSEKPTEFKYLPRITTNPDQLTFKITNDK